MRRVVASRCTLEPQVEAHAAEMFRVLADPAIYEFENEPPVSEEWLASRYRRLESRRSADDTEQWLNWVVRVSDGRPAGYVQATVRPSGIALVAIELNSAHWRQGIGSSAMEAMLAELHSEYAVHTCAAVLKARNFRSEALLRSLGFAPAGAQVQARIRAAADEQVLVRMDAQARNAAPPAPNASAAAQEKRQ